MGARDRIRTYLLENVGQVVSTNDIARVAKIRDYQRRIRELRNEEGLQILTHRDKHDLKPGQYLLISSVAVPVIGRGISAQLRMEIMERNGFSCQLCGRTANDPDPLNTNRKIQLHIDHINPASHGGSVDKNNLRVLCSVCNQGRSNLQVATEGAKSILARIRRLPRQIQIEIYEALKRSYEPAT